MSLDFTLTSEILVEPEGLYMVQLERAQFGASPLDSLVVRREAAGFFVGVGEMPILPEYGARYLTILATAMEDWRYPGFPVQVCLSDDEKVLGIEGVFVVFHDRTRCNDYQTRLEIIAALHQAAKEIRSQCR